MNRVVLCDLAAKIGSLKIKARRDKPVLEMSNLYAIHQQKSK